MNQNLYIQKNLENIGGIHQYWWNLSTATKVPHNKLDLIIWNWETKVCTILEFSCPLEIKTIKKVSKKLEVYALLVRNQQIMYLCYKFEIASTVVRAMGYVPKCLLTYLKMVVFEGKEIKLLIHTMPVKSISLLIFAKRFWISMTI